MKFILVEPSDRIKKKPDKILKLISDGDFSEKGFKIKNLTLHYYIEGNDDKLGPYCLITSFLETDKASIELTYDEGYRGDNPLDRVGEFLTEHLGLSAIILRSTIALKNELSHSNT